MSTDSNDQWLSDGDCSKCRRKKYCGTRCRACKLRIQELTQKYIRENTILGGVSDFINRQRGCNFYAGLSNR